MAADKRSHVWPAAPGPETGGGMGRSWFVGVAAALVLASGAQAQADNGLAARITQYETLVRDTGDGGVLWLLAEAYAQAGRKDDALKALGQLADRRMGFVPTPDSPLAKLAGDPGYDALAARMAAEAPKVLTGRTAYTVRMPQLIPEGVAYDAEHGRLFLGDAVHRRIVSVDRGGRPEPYGAPLAMPPLGMKVDAPRGRLLVATTNAFWTTRQKRAELVALDLRTRRPIGVWTHPDAVSFNDLDVAANGDVYVSDSEGGAVFRLRGGAMDRLTPAGGLGYPNGVALSRDGRHLFVAQGVSLRRVDTATGEVTRVANPPNFTTLGVDGLYRRGDDLIGVQNIGTPGRVVRMRLAPNLDRITHFEVLRSGDPGFDIPTTAALAGDRLLVLANAQIDRLKPDGSIDASKPLNPIRIVEIPLS
jgi:sugar lactone lactonase YvrE